MTVTTIIVCALIGLLVALIGCSILKGQLRSVEFRSNATEYEKPGSFRLTGQRDSFLYKRVEKREKPKQQEKNS